MRAIQEELQARLDGGATTLCRCWKIERRDGRIFGFTDHDEDLSFDGLTFLASSGLDANALQSSTGLSVDNCQAQGALSSDAISEDDIRAGRFDRASIVHWLVDWQRTDLRLPLFRGVLGEIRRSDGRFEVELRGPTEDMNVPVGRSILRTCDRALGDERCRFDVGREGFTAEVAVTATGEGSTLTCSGLTDYARNWFAEGRVTWLSGRNEGTTRSIRADRRNADGTRELDLWHEPPWPFSEGDRVRVVAGCDKRAETCRAKFGNFLNFRGFPHLPGEDWVAAYPKEGEVHDGSSLE
jgi:uncharacterized phage protein (TIGR02218 family)